MTSLIPGEAMVSDLSLEPVTPLEEHLPGYFPHRSPYSKSDTTTSLPSAKDDTAPTTDSATSGAAGTILIGATAGLVLGSPVGVALAVGLLGLKVMEGNGLQARGIDSTHTGLERQVGGGTLSPVLKEVGGGEEDVAKLLNAGAGGASILDHEVVSEPKVADGGLPTGQTPDYDRDLSEPTFAKESILFLPGAGAVAGLNAVDTDTVDEGATPAFERHQLTSLPPNEKSSSASGFNSSIDGLGKQTVDSKSGTQQFDSKAQNFTERQLDEGHSEEDLGYTGNDVRTAVVGRTLAAGAGGYASDRLSANDVLNTPPTNHLNELLDQHASSKTVTSVNSDSSLASTVLPAPFQQHISEYSHFSNNDSSSTLLPRPNLTSHFSDSTFASTSTESGLSEEFGFGNQQGLPANVNVVPAFRDDEEGSILSDEPAKTRSTLGGGTGVVPLEHRSTWSRETEMALGGAGVAGIGAAAVQRKHGNGAATPQDLHVTPSTQEPAGVLNPPTSRFTEGNYGEGATYESPQNLSRDYPSSSIPSSSSKYSDINSPVREHLIPPTTSSPPKVDREIRNKARSGTVTESSYRPESPITKPNPVEHSPHMKIATRKDSIGRNRLHKDSLDKHVEKNNDQVETLVGEDQVRREENREDSRYEPNTEVRRGREDISGEGGVWNASVAHVVNDETAVRGGQRPAFVSIDPEDRADYQESPSRVYATSPRPTRHDLVPSSAPQMRSDSVKPLDYTSPSTPTSSASQSPQLPSKEHLPASSGSIGRTNKLTKNRRASIGSGSGSGSGRETMDHVGQSTSPSGSVVKKEGFLHKVFHRHGKEGSDRS